MFCPTRGLALGLLLVSTVSASAQSGLQFPDATETVPELIELWDQADSVCRVSRSHDVKVAAACLSRSVFGVAINERNWCKGKEAQSNADMAWHECQADSLRFPRFQVPDGVR